jgi:hypothetical protein
MIYLYFITLGTSCIYLKHFCNILFISFKKNFNAPFLSRTVGKHTWRISKCKENYNFFARDMVSSRICSTLWGNRDFKGECVKKLRFKRLANNIVNENWNSVQTFYSITSNYRKTRTTWSKTIYNI